MANSKISALTAQTTLADTDMLVVANSGSTTKKITALNAKKDASFTKATSMPGSPATNQMCFRTDLGLLFYYDGTRWLTTELFVYPLDLINPSQGVTSFAQQMMPVQILDMWLDSIKVWATATVNNSGSAYWTATLQKYTAAGTPTSITSVNTQTATTANTSVLLSSSIGAALGGSTYHRIILDWASTGSSGNLQALGQLLYRLIGT